jgi:BTB/POZ domain-containing protein KCTD9
MAGVNLRIANLKNANLMNCNLRAAVLAGADLEVSLSLLRQTFA